MLVARRRHGRDRVRCRGPPRIGRDFSLRARAAVRVRAALFVEDLRGVPGLPRRPRSGSEAAPVEDEAPGRREGSEMIATLTVEGAIEAFAHYCTANLNLRPG